MKLLTTALIFALAAPTFSGGLVIEDETTEVSPARDRNGWIVPVIITGIALCLILCGGSDDAPPVVVPGPVCKTGC